MLPDSKLTLDFNLYQFLHSQIAERDPKLREKQYSPSPEVVKEIKKTAILLQRIFDRLKVEYEDNRISIVISSGYRCHELNKLVKGSKTSDHMYGRAVDFKVILNGRESGEVYKKTVQIIYNNFEFYQLIWEYGTNTQPAWLHLSQRDGQNIKQLLKIGSYTGGKYTPFKI
jgi:hypothetical protein